MKKIIFIAGAKRAYPRNSNAIKMLEKNFEVKEITSMAGSYFKRLPLLAIRFLFARKNVDAIYAGWLGHPFVIMAKLLTRRPIIFDVFVSLYDTICLERKAVSRDSLLGRFIFWIDKISCKWSDIIIVDTEQNADFFVQTFGVSPNKIRVFYVCADGVLFKPGNEKKEKKFVVGFYGSFIPAQGVEYIIRAAKILEDQPDILFKLLGSGRDLLGAKDLAKRLGLNNVEFISNFVPIEKLPDFISNADIGLGLFGVVEKTRRAVPNKAYEAVACRKPVISADTKAMREIFQDKYDILFCRAGDPQDLADKIVLLKNDEKLRNTIAENGYRTFQRVCDFDSRVKQLTGFVLESVK